MQNDYIDELPKLLNKFFSLRCFLSYKFSVENDKVILQVRNFLELLKIEVTTAEAYEPRKISDKVFSKLHEDLDLVVLSTN